MHDDLGLPLGSEELADLVGAEWAVADQGDGQRDTERRQELNELGQPFESNGGGSS